MERNIFIFILFDYKIILMAYIILYEDGDSIIMIKIINEVRKDDGNYFCGPFWIIADSFENILKGEFSLESVKYLCNYNGDFINNETSKSQKTHRKAWDTLKSNYNNVEWTYYPRGRVSIYDGKAYIHLNSKCNIPKVIDAIVNEYIISNLEIIVDLNDTYQGSHYQFELK